MIYQLGNVQKEKDRCTCLRHWFSIFLQTKRETTNTSVMTTGVLDEIRSWNSPSRGVTGQQLTWRFLRCFFGNIRFSHYSHKPTTVSTASQPIYLLFILILLSRLRQGIIRNLRLNPRLLSSLICNYCHIHYMSLYYLILACNIVKITSNISHRIIEIQYLHTYCIIYRRRQT